MNVSVIIATFGSDGWCDAAWSHAYPSTFGQDASEVIVKHLPDGTLAGARNEAAAEATGAWLCLLDADDSLAGNYLRAMRAAARHSNLWRPHDLLANPTLLVPAVQYVRDGKCVGRAEIPNGGDKPGAAERMIDVSCCVIGTLIPRSLFAEVGGFRDILNDGTPLTSLEDFDLFLRCQIAGARLVMVPDAVYCATVNGGRNRDQSPYAAIRAELEPAWRAALTLA